MTTVNLTTHERMHGEHCLWENEIEMWREDLQAWEDELAAAQAQLREVEKAFAQHARTLQQHGAALRLEEDAACCHEHEIAQFEQGHEGESLFEMAREHSQEALRHAAHRTVHEHLKRLHHTVMAHWNVLLRALRDPIVMMPPQSS